VEPLPPQGEIEWLWPGRIALGKVTVIEGAPGAGKSRLAFDLAERVRRSLPWPDGTPNRLPAADVLVVSRHKEAGRVVISRFQEPGEYRRQLLRFRGFWTEAPEIDHDCERPVALPFDLEALEYYLENHASVGMVIIDPLSDFCATPKLMAETLHQLHELAERLPIAFIVTVPANCRTDPRGGLRVTSRWPTEAARCAWCIVPDPDDPSRRLFVAKRTNFCAEPQGLAFCLDDGGVAWEAGSAVNPVDPLGQLSAGELCLKALLSAGPLPAATVYRLGAEHGLSQKELRGAASRLGVTSARVGFGAGGHWEWSLANPADPLIGASDRLVARSTSVSYSTHCAGEAGEGGKRLVAPHADPETLASRGRELSCDSPPPVNGFPLCEQQVAAAAVPVGVEAPSERMPVDGAALPRTAVAHAACSNQPAERDGRSKRSAESTVVETKVQTLSTQSAGAVDDHSETDEPAQTRDEGPAASDATPAGHACAIPRRKARKARRRPDPQPA
ncbi:MAG: AAA family ATPase, partial [Deltaproteobacteria bacterium]